MSLSPSILKKTFPQRDPWSHKGEYGKLLIISGSEIFTGSPILTGMAAIRTGVDVAYLTGPRRAMDIAASYYPSFITMPLDGTHVEKHHIDSIIDFAASMKVNALTVGPGLWRDQDTRLAVLNIINDFEVPMVIDADGIRALAGNTDVLEGKQVILTPHTNEFKELTGEDVEKNVQDREKKVRACAKELGVTIVLKGHVDVISDGTRTVTNNSGNVNMSKGGFGDTLTGICGALIARRKDKIDTYNAACAAAFINGRAGSMAAKEKGISLTPLDMIEKIPDAIKGR